MYFPDRGVYTPYSSCMSTPLAVAIDIDELLMDFSCLRFFRFSFFFVLVLVVSFLFSFSIFLDVGQSGFYFLPSLVCFLSS